MALDSADFPMGEWSLNPVFDSPTLVVVCGAALVGLLMLLSPELRRLSRGKRYALLAMRLAIFLFIVLAMLRPTFIYTKESRLPATIVVLADRSKSMQIEDETGSVSRWEALRRTLADASPALRELASAEAGYEVKLYTFDADIAPRELNAGPVDLGPQPTGKQTAIGAALKDVRLRESGKRVAAVILLSDGAQQAYAPRDIAPQTEARELARQGIPLYSLSFGQERAASQARDLAITELLVNPTVYVKNELTVAGTLRVDGMVNREIPIEVLFETSPGKMETVARQKVTANESNQQISISEIYVPQTPGEYKVTLRAIAPDGQTELVTTNNELSTFITVLEGGLNVLYLEGQLRPETRWIKRAIDASPDIRLELLRFDERRLRDDASRKRWQAEMAEKFQPGKYNVYILGDLDSTAFSTENLSALVQAVERGAGLMMIGGYHSFWPGGYQRTPLADILPLEVGDLDRATRQQFNEPIIKDPKVHLPGPLVMIPDQRFGGVSFMQLAGREANEREWRKLPPLLGANAFRALKRTAKSLAVTPDGNVLLAALEPGAGRVLAFGGDSTWQWAMQGFGQIHRRFWRQVILWLAHVDESGAGSVWVKLDQRRISPGRRIEFSAGLNSATPDIPADAALSGQLVRPDGSRLPLRLSRAGDKWTGAASDTQNAGDYRIEVSGLAGGASLGQASGRFVVHDQDLELDNPAARPALLAGLSKITAPAGRAVPYEDFPKLLEELKNKPPELKIESQTKATPWDTPWFFLAVVGLLSTEWYLRKRWGLV